MAEFCFTPSQEKAIKARGGAILVSAAAGSGKTRVLTERLLAHITDKEDPKDIGDFLVITYTRAAAAELRSRVVDSLAALEALDPSNRRLRRQRDMCYRAEIGTIHGFCANVVRENCHLLGLPSDVGILDEERSASMRNLALARLLERRYEGIGEDEGFKSAVDTVGAGRDDQRLAGLVLSLHTRMMSEPDPKGWAAHVSASLENAESDVAETPWGAAILSDAKADAGWLSAELAALLSALDAAGERAAKAYGDSLAATAESVRAFQSALGKGWDEAVGALPIRFPSLKPLRDAPDAAREIKARRELCKRVAEDFQGAFSAPSAKLLADLAATAPAMQAILRLALDLESAFSAEKRRLGMLDFSDLEHCALFILADGGGCATPAAEALQRRFHEVMVDEYQDVSALQERILQYVSRSGENLFMVGDVKQSVYRFRLAEPRIFIEKYLSYAEGGKAGRRILLRENFRSRRAVLNAVNQVFSLIMSAKLGEIDYDESSALVYGASYTGEDSPAELRLLRLPEKDEEAETPEKSALEAAYAAREIRALVESGFPVEERGAKRPVAYGDIALLLRSPKAVGGDYRRALLREGVPVSSDQGGGFFTSGIVTALLSLLAVLDNPHQDVPLISALRSPFFGFTPDELAFIRAASPEGDFYSALEKAAEQDEKCAAFLQNLRALRAGAKDRELPALLWSVYDRFSMIAVCCALPDGEAERGNLMQLVEYAVAFTEKGLRGLHRFVRFLRDLSERGAEPPVGAPGNAVRIMSIHKSKGLEFPVVFLCGTSRRFNIQDLAENVLVHPELGLGPKVTDTERGIEYPTVARMAVYARKKREMLSEEMRLLYVAMTRAREKLVITAALRDPEGELEKLAAAGIPAPQVLQRDASPAAWLIRAASAGGAIKTSVVECRAETEAEGPPEAREAEGEGTAPAAAFGEALSRNLGYRYPYAGAVSMPSKLTATELKGAPGFEGDPEAKAFIRRFEPRARRPNFIRERKPLTGAEKGVAAHLVMQHIDFAKAGTEEGIRAEIGRLFHEKRITEREREAVDPKTIFAFFSSDLGRRVCKADAVLREFRFSLLVPGSDFFEGGTEDKVLLQGVVDCCIEERGELTIIDYKTDYVTKETVNERAALYAGQVGAYAAAMERITGKPVREAHLFFLLAGAAFKMP